MFDCSWIAALTVATKVEGVASTTMNLELGNSMQRLSWISLKGWSSWSLSLISWHQVFLVADFFVADFWRGQRPFRNDLFDAVLFWSRVPLRGNAKMLHQFIQLWFLHCIEYPVAWFFWSCGLKIWDFDDWPRTDKLRDHFPITLNKEDRIHDVLLQDFRKVRYKMNFQ